MSGFQEKLEKYAELAVKVGVNVQKGQTLVVNAPLIAAPFVRLIAKKAYEIGAYNVHVEWSDEVITRLKFDLAPDEAFKEYPMWKAKGYEELAEAGASFSIHQTAESRFAQGRRSGSYCHCKQGCWSGHAQISQLCNVR